LRELAAHKGSRKGAQGFRPKAKNPNSILMVTITALLSQMRDSASTQIGIREAM
jgi:hypothetical protein